MKRALVVGLARSGRAAVPVLRREGWDVIAYDRAPDLDATGLDVTGLDADVHLGHWDERFLDGVDLIVKSPGVPNTSDPLLAACRRGVPWISEIELAARSLVNPLIGVTGTNGKTTTTSLLGAMFAAAGRPVEVAGNIGRPLVSLVGEADPASWIVCELSSFQLEDIETLRPRVAILLNLEPDHIDRHGTFDDYAAAKLRVFENQADGDVAIVPRGFGVVPGAGRRVEFAAIDALPAEPLIRGAHNRENAAAAVAAARAAGLSESAIGQALRTFPGVEHRIELVAEVAGVRYVNDSKATNVAAALRALASFPESRLHVILGGRGKKEDYGPLAAAFRPDDRAYLIGEAAPEIEPALLAAGVPVRPSGTLQQAVADAAARADEGDVVLLSPACASFDQFLDYEARGEEFRELVAKLGG